MPYRHIAIFAIAAILAGLSLRLSGQDSPADGQPASQGTSPSREFILARVRERIAGEKASRQAEEDAFCSRRERLEEARKAFVPGDGTAEERSGAENAALLSVYDTDGDGMLDPAEAAVLRRDRSSDARRRERARKNGRRGHGRGEGSRGPSSAAEEGAE